jgi:hypothetical protein
MSEPSLDSNSPSPDNKNLLGGYLAGLIEGDGSIIVPKTIRNQKDEDNFRFSVLHHNNVHSLYY